MRLIDRIALNRAIKLLSNFIIQLVEIFKKKQEDRPKPDIIKPPRPLKKIVDVLTPWRHK